MDDVELVWSRTPTCEVHRFVVGPVDNNVYVVRCRRTGRRRLIDAANEHDRLLRVARRLGVTSVLETHGHWDHIRPVEQVREAGIDVWVSRRGCGTCCPATTISLDDDVRSRWGDLRLRTVAHAGPHAGLDLVRPREHPAPVHRRHALPRGPGQHRASRGATSPRSSRSIEERIFGAFGDETIIWPGHGAPSTLGAERPHLDEWVERGW